jgi:4-hydroxy-3-polyprenylbenzoate decarboxylase
MGKATERLFLPLMKLFFGELLDVNMPAEGVFHNLVLVSIKKRYPGHAQKVMYGLWGLGLMMLAKGIVVFDNDVDVQNLEAVARRLLETVDWRRDVTVVDGPVDQLDHSAIRDSYGGKIGVDATIKPNRQPFPDNQPVPADAVSEIVAGDWHQWCDSVLVVTLDKAHDKPQALMQKLWDICPDQNIVILDRAVDIKNLSDVAWRTLGNVDWRRDIVIKDGPVDPYDSGDSPRGQIGIDATSKSEVDGHPRGWPEEIVMSPEIVERVDEKWKAYGFR